MAEETPGGEGQPKIPIPLPRKPEDRAGAPKTEMICAPLDLDVGEGVGEGTMKQAFVPSDIKAALKDLASAKAEAVPEHLRALAQAAKKAHPAESVPGEGTDKGGPPPGAVE